MADNAYFVYLSDKHDSPYSIGEPELFLSQRAIDRREHQQIAIDSTDLPVNPAYLQALREAGACILHTSRWLNGVSLTASDEAIDQIANLCFVDSIECTRRDTSSAKSQTRRPAKDLFQDLSADYGLTAAQTRQIRLDRLHEAGFRGEGTMIAIVDNGFKSADTLEAFALARKQITDTLNLVPENGSIYKAGDHGTYVFSIIAGYAPDSYLGGATEASYVLIRSEDDDRESRLEVDNQVRAFEFADSVGADIINSSLGYYIFDDTLTNFTYADMDGRTARNSLCATMAARKGMILCISAGNEAQKAWHYIGSPADADSILTIGSVDSLGNYSSFSSVGPTADGRVKPDIATMGSRTAIIYPNGSQKRGNGTSFASPVAAAMVACLWSALPELTNMQLIERIKHYSSQALKPDTLLGWGIPDAWSCYLDHFDSDTPTQELSAADSMTLPEESCYYDVLGRRVSNPKNGIFIRIRRGKAQKVRIEN